MGFDLDSATRRRLGYRLIDQIDAYFSSLPDRPVQLPADQRTFGTLDDALPEIGEDPGKVLDEICREMVDKGFNVQRELLWINESHANLHGRVGRGAGGGAEPATRNIGAFAVGVENRT